MAGSSSKNKKHLATVDRSGEGCGWGVGNHFDHPWTYRPHQNDETILHRGYFYVNMFFFNALMIPQHPSDDPLMSLW